MNRVRQGRSRRKRKGLFVLAFVATLILLAGIAASIALERLGVPPRTLAPYIEKRVSQHNSVIVGTGEWVARQLVRHDRGDGIVIRPEKLKVGARHDGAPVAGEPAGERIVVATPASALAAFAQARPGQVIEFQPGRYDFHAPYITIDKPGEAARPIVVRAAAPGSVVLRMDTAEGFHVSAPYWTFENLRLEGACALDANCEHAFHVVGNAHHFVARNNVIVDFNSHFKINGADGRFPDEGLLERNTLTNTAVRKTDSSVTPVDLVAANRWTIRGNMIADFIKGGSNRISYGAFVKGGGEDNRIEGNLVVCEMKLKGVPGQRVGLSLGGGGTGAAYCRDKRCIVEQSRGRIESNVVASCSDDGIYVNRGAASTIAHNTLLDTGGIVVRFPESTADVVGNLVDGAIRSRDEGLARADDNFETSMTKLYAGMHPVRRMFDASGLLPLQWTDAPPRRAGDAPSSTDMCARTRPQRPAYGAFEDFTACLR